MPADAESVHSQSVRAHISHAVIATYAADAAREVPGVHGLLGGQFGSAGRRTDPERSAKAVRVLTHNGDDRLSLELHLVIAWDRSVPEVAAAVGDEVRRYLRSMIDLEVAEITVFVDGLAAPDGRTVAL